MEYVPGQNLKDVDLETREDIVPHIAEIVAHMGQIQGDKETRGHLAQLAMVNQRAIYGAMMVRKPYSTLSRH